MTDPNSTNQQTQQQLALPSSSSFSDAATTTKIDTSSTQSTVKLDHLGPLVINSDGTLSRIQNWDGMTEAERERTLRVLGKRNMLRREKLVGQEEEEEEGKS